MQATNLYAGPVGASSAARHATSVPTSGVAAWRAFAQIPDLVNGDPANFSFIFVSAGLADPYHWITDSMFASMPDPDTEANYKLRVSAEAACYSYRMAADGFDLAKARFHGVVLATARAAVRRAWGVSNRDIVDTQLFTPDNIPGDPTASPPVPSRPARLDAAGRMNGDCPSFGTAATFEAERVACETVFDTYADSLLHSVSFAAIGMPACNGCVIVATLVHHYVDPHKPICDAVIDQHFGANFAPPGGMTIEELKDLICHKTAHPIKSSILVGLARSTEVKTRLNAIGHGSATVRLPALFQPEKAASALHALVSKAAQAGKASNVAVDTTASSTLVLAVTKVLSDDPSQTGMLSAAKLVEDFKLSHGLHVAWLGGFMAAMFDESRATKRARSILESYAVKGLMEEEQPSYAEGYSHYQDAAKWRRSRARDGHLAGYGLMGADDPKAFRNPEHQHDEENN